MRVMVLTPYLPHRKIGHGGGTAVRDLVRHLAADHEVLLVALVRPEETALVGEVAELGAAVAPLPFSDRTATGISRARLAASRLRSAVRSLQTGFPHYVEKYWSLSLRGKLVQLVDEFRPEAIQIEYLQMSLYARDIQFWRESRRVQQPRIVLNTHELGSVPRLRRARRSANPWQRRYQLFEARRWQRLQQEACRWADRVLCVTDEDRKIYEQQGGQNLLTVPLGMDLQAVKPDRAPEGQSCLFVGSFGHRPNVLAADLLVRDIWPRVRAARPTATLTLVGRGSRRFLAGCGPTCAGLSALGFVDDLGAVFRRHRLFVAPLPEGGGIKIKILEAMARGIPVVTTPVGAEGIASEQDDVLGIAPAGAGFAEAVLADLEDPASEERALRARLHMERNFGWEAIARRLAGIYRGEE